MVGKVLLLIALCLALYVPGLSNVPPLDRDEARFAQATRQMVQSGDFIHPRFQAESRLRKPIGIYWLQSLSVAAAGTPTGAIWPYRLPSVIGALLAVVLTLAMGRVLFSPSVAFLGAALLAAAVLVVVEAHMATTDAVQLASIVAAQSCLALLYVANRAGRIAPARYAAGFWIAQGVGMLVKGPVAALVSGLTIVALAIADRNANGPGWRHQLRPQWGVFLGTAVILPWAIAIGWTAGLSLPREWLGDVLPKLLGGHESHGAPPGTYLLLLPVTFWPGSIAAGLAVVTGMRLRARTGERFCLAWLLPAWIFFELVPTKLPHYVLPLFPPLAILAASALADASAPRRAERIVATFGVVVWSLVGITIAAAALIAPMWFGTGFNLGGAMASLVGVGLVLVVVRLYRDGQLPLAARILPVGAALMMFLVFASVLPRLDQLWLSRSAARAIAERSGEMPSPRPLAVAGYHEPSLVFLLNEQVHMMGPEDGAEFLGSHGEALLLLSDHARESFEHAARQRGLHVRELWSASGFNYSKGQPVTLHLLERTRPSALAAEPQP